MAGDGWEIRLGRGDMRRESGWWQMAQPVSCASEGLDCKGCCNIGTCFCPGNVKLYIYINCSVSSEGRTVLLEDQRKLPGRGSFMQV